MQNKEEERALVNVENKLKEMGFLENFKVTNGRLYTFKNDQQGYAPEEVSIADFYRFEGESNPDDMSILYAVECHDGTRGTISVAYGVYAESEMDTFEFFKRVEDLGKNLDKAHK